MVNFIRKKFSLIFIFSFILINQYAKSQDITAYNDYRRYLQVFDRGFFRQLEYLQVLDYKIGGNTIAYIDSKNDFKVYYDGQTIPLVNAADFDYVVTDNLTAFRVGKVLYAFDKGEKKTLCYYTDTTTIEVNDSLLAYFDEVQSSLNIYYNGRLSTAEEALLSRPKFIRTGSNIVAWVNQSDYFIVFYHGNAVQLDNMAPRRFEVGRDIIAYIDNYEQRFRLFYHGDTAMIDEFEPDSFKVGFGIMAYTDQSGNFNIFDDGAIKKILSHEPDFFYVKGNTVVYSFNKAFNVYYKGEVYTLQFDTPANFQLGNDGLAWIDDSGRLQLFHKGKTYIVSYETVTNYSLNGNVLKYEVGVNTVNVFYNGKNY